MAHWLKVDQAYSGAMTAQELIDKEIEKCKRRIRLLEARKDRRGHTPYIGYELRQEEGKLNGLRLAKTCIKYAEVK